MGRVRTWTDEDLRKAVITSLSYRSVIKRLGLIPAGGNYVQVKQRASELNLNTDHFTGQSWNKGRHYFTKLRPEIETLLIAGGKIQSYKLKKRLIEEGLKSQECELCGWAQMSKDGRIPVELDHINGIRNDNRLENLRILCPNCHSLQPTHRGKNKRVALRLQRARVLEPVDKRHLKCRALNRREGSSPSPRTIQRRLNSCIKHAK